MNGPTFDATGAVQFDLSRGLALDARGDRLVLLPVAALETLDDATLARLGAEVGRACGERLASRLGGEAAVRTSSLEAVVSHLAGELAVTGVGSLHLERWGRALVLVVDDPGVANDTFVAAVLTSAISSAARRDAQAGAIAHDGVTTRFFVGARATVQRAQALADEGRSYPEIVAALQSEPS